MFFFFFQAEDGIRDYKVTGVQTCALPISHFGYKKVQVDKIIDSVHFVQSHNNYLMQLTDVMCYLIRRGKKGQGEIYAEYLTRSEEGRVGGEGRFRWAPYHLKKKKKKHNDE